RSQSGNALGGDLRQRTVSTSARLPVVAGPVSLGRHGLVLSCGFSKQVDPAIVAEQLQIGGALVEHDSLDCTATGERDLRAVRGGTFARAQRADVADELLRFGGAHIGER